MNGTRLNPTWQGHNRIGHSPDIGAGHSGVHTQYSHCAHRSRSSTPKQAAAWRSTTRRFGLIHSGMVCASILLLQACCCQTSLAKTWSWPFSAAGTQQPHPAVARITVPESDGYSQGTGTLVGTGGRFGLVVTAWHVVRDAAGTVTVSFPDGFQSTARVLKVDRDWDLAALMTWRPTVPPVPLATTAPRPGDVLTIAGYGTGSYRAVSGRCTQYVSPSDHHPYEMVELSAVARQGDSGGPIFNTEGQLAGVLFGSDGGTTSGSYSGRVRLFLSTAWPPHLSDSSGTPNPVDPQTTAASPIPIPGQSPTDASQVPVGPSGSASRPSRADNSPLVPLPQFAASRSQFASTESPQSDPSTPKQLVSNAPQNSDQKTETNGLTWRHFAGNTFAEQMKSLLAVIGAFAIFFQLTRLLSKG